MIKADLHVHTNISDCSTGAESILKIAKTRGITHIAFTDHDTTKNAQEHVELAAKYGIIAVKAVEMSAFHKKSGKKVHILGFDYKDNGHIEKIGEETLRRRNENCLKKIEILRDLGFKMNLNEITSLAGECIYKQHILDYLVKSGQEEKVFGKVYQKVFKNGGMCDFDIEYPEAQQVVEAICLDGGYGVMAHAGQQNNFELVPELVEAGLSGMERNHPANSCRHRQLIDGLCNKYKLFQTAGSDFHGKYGKNAFELGGEYIEDITRIPFLV